ncbi:MAG: metallophosphoesterase family protein [Clostridia bacterium]|nr:metallophosphoesterase family protein [Clostridia bacterium]
MRILAISDEPSDRLWGDRCREMLRGIDLILSAGDLPSAYLSFLTCFTNAPVVYVHGNHDDHYAKKPPEGCLCSDGKILQIQGVRILGLGGSVRYRPDAVHMYSESEMASRISSLRRKLRATGGFDILLTHAPIRGVGDQDTMSHRGFECFGPLLDRYRPAVMVHGHMHQSYTAFFKREREYHGIPVINASNSYVFDLPETPDRKEPTRRGLRLMEKASRFE